MLLATAGSVLRNLRGAGKLLKYRDKDYKKHLDTLFGGFGGYTLINTPNGNIPAKEIESGMEINVYDPENKIDKPIKVLEIHRDEGDVCKIKTKKGILYISPYQTVFIDNSDYEGRGMWLEGKDLEKDQVYFDRYAQFNKILNIEDYRTYIHTFVLDFPNKVPIITIIPYNDPNIIIDSDYIGKPLYTDCTCMGGYMKKHMGKYDKKGRWNLLYNLN